MQHWIASMDYTGRQTPFHKGPHMRHSCPQRSSCNMYLLGILQSNSQVTFTCMATFALCQTDRSVAAKQQTAPLTNTKLSHSYQAMWAKCFAQKHNGRNWDGVGWGFKLPAFWSLNNPLYLLSYNRYFCNILM